MRGLRIRGLLCEKDAAAFPLAQQVRERASTGDTPPADRGPRRGLDKDTVHLVAFPGELLKACPGTGEGYICCGYQILNVGTNCPLDCSYCILQAYMNQPSLRLFVNLPEALPGIGCRLDADPTRVWRMGTGEFTDSLALDPLAEWSRWLPPFVAKHPNAVLELKTKTDLIEGLIASPHRDRLVVAWSLNSPRIVAREEHGAPSLEKRLRAARQCQEEGYVVAFHFDPLVPHAGWKGGYARTVELLDRFVRPDRVLWISMGTMRFMPSLKAVIRRRHPGSEVLHGEFVPGLDGKMRLFKPLRIEMYAFLRELVSAWNPDAGLYLCMERPEVWHAAMGWSPETTAGLAAFLDDRARNTFSML